MSYQTTNSTSSTSLIASKYSSRKENVLWKGRKCAYCVSCLLGSLGVAGVTGTVFCALDPSGEIDLPYWMLGVMSLALTVIGCLGACCLYCYVPSNNYSHKVREINDQRRSEEQIRRNLDEKSRTYQNEIGRENKIQRDLEQQREDVDQERRSCQTGIRQQNAEGRSFQENALVHIQNSLEAVNRINTPNGDGSEVYIPEDAGELISNIA